MLGVPVFYSFLWSSYSLYGSGSCFFCWGSLWRIWQAHLAKMRAVFSEIREQSSSDDGDECITFAMLEEKINSPTVQQLLETLGCLICTGNFWLCLLLLEVFNPLKRIYFIFLKVWLLWGLDVWDAWSFFKLLDTDGGGSIELEVHQGVFFLILRFFLSNRWFQTFFDFPQYSGWLVA